MAGQSGPYRSTEAGHFAVGKIDRDQVKDWAKRKDMSLTDAERWLAPNHDPA